MGWHKVGMLGLLSLLMPALIPSWAFFKAVEPSPRVQWRKVHCDDDRDEQWQDFRARPQHLSPFQIMLRLFWNPNWNEVLYSVSLAERLTLQPTDHSYQELCRLIKGQVGTSGPQRAQFRLVFVQRESGQLCQDVTFLSDPFDTVTP